jgi:hypothetical protein
VAKSSSIYPQDAVVEIKRKIVEGKERKGKEREGVRSAINLWPGGHTSPPPSQETREEGSTPKDLF